MSIGTALSVVAPTRLVSVVLGSALCGFPVHVVILQPIMADELNWGKEPPLVLPVSVRSRMHDKFLGSIPYRGCRVKAVCPADKRHRRAVYRPRAEGFYLYCTRCGTCIEQSMDYKTIYRLLRA
jgi:hypothetical protein